MLIVPLLREFEVHQLKAHRMPGCFLACTTNKTIPTYATIWNGPYSRVHPKLTRWLKDQRNAPITPGKEQPKLELGSINADTE